MKNVKTNANITAIWSGLMLMALLSGGLLKSSYAAEAQGGQGTTAAFAGTYYYNACEDNCGLTCDMIIQIQTKTVYCCAWDLGCFLNPFEENSQKSPCKRDERVCIELDEEDPESPLQTAYPCCSEKYNCTEENGQPCCDPQTGWVCPPL